MLVLVAVVAFAFKGQYMLAASGVPVDVSAIKRYWHFCRSWQRATKKDSTAVSQLCKPTPAGTIESSDHSSRPTMSVALEEVGVQSCLLGDPKRRDDAAEVTITTYTL